MFRNVGSNWLLGLATIAATYFLMPFVIHTLGEGHYGTWLLITSILGYMELLGLGIPMASVRYFAEPAAEGDIATLNKTIGTCTGLYLIMGTVALLASAGLFVFFFWTYDISEVWRHEAHLAFGLQAFYVAAGFISMVPKSIMAAHHDFVRLNQILLGSLLLRCILTVGLLTLRASLVFLALTQITCLAFEFSISWLLVRRLYPGIRIHPGDFDLQRARQIFSFSLYVLLLSIAGRLAFHTDSLVIGSYMDVSWIAYYAVANTLMLYLMEFILSIAAVIMPMATKLQAEAKSSDLAELFLKWSKIAVSITTVTGLFLVVLGPRFIGWWIGPSFEESSGLTLQILMISYFVFLPVRGVAQPILMGLGKPRIPTLTFLASAVLNLGLSLLLVGPLGLIGVALGTALPHVIYALVVLVLTCGELQTSLREYLQYVVLKAFLGALPVLLLLLWIRSSIDVKGLVALGGAGLVMMLLFGVIWVFFVYRNDPYLELRRGLVQLVSRR